MIHSIKTGILYMYGVWRNSKDNRWNYPMPVLMKFHTSSKRGMKNGSESSNNHWNCIKTTATVCI